MKNLILIFFTALLSSGLSVAHAQTSDTYQKLLCVVDPNGEAKAIVQGQTAVFMNGTCQTDRSENFSCECPSVFGPLMGTVQKWTLNKNTPEQYRESVSIHLSEWLKEADAETRERILNCQKELGLAQKEIVWNLSNTPEASSREDLKLWFDVTNESERQKIRRCFHHLNSKLQVISALKSKDSTGIN